MNFTGVAQISLVVGNLTVIVDNAYHVTCMLVRLF